jgi:hypothetical protein
MRLPRMTTRRWMGTMPVIALLLGIVLAVMREIEREFPSTPAGWAWKEVAGFERWPEGHTLAMEFRQLALAFERTGEVWGEGTYQGPFTDQLAAGQSVEIRDGALAHPSDLEGRQLQKVEARPIDPGTIGVVMKDRAFDADSCRPFRDILVRFVDGPHRGEIACVDRIYLRRWHGSLASDGRVR